MKFLLILGAFLLFLITKSYTQDLIILANSDTIKCKIIEDKVSFVAYTFYNTNDTSIHKINQSDYDYYIIKSDVQLKLEDAVLYSNEKPSPKKTYKKGIYETFEQLVIDSPSFDFKFEIIRRSENDIALMGGNDYKISSLSDTFSNRYIRKAWVICDGDYCYINCQQFSPFRFFSILTFEDNYAYFSALPFDKRKSDSLGNMGGAIGGAASGAAAALERKLYKIYLEGGKIEPYYKVLK